MSSRRPTQVPRWAWGVSATLVQPPTLSAENGFAAAQRPPAPWFNWQFNALGAWVDFLRGPNTSQWARTAWGTSPGSYDSSSLVLLAVDATTLDATGAAYRIVIAGWETSGPTTTLHVSQTGAAWTRRTNTPGGVGNPTALAHLNNTARWILADDTPALWYAPHDAGAGTSPVGGSSSGWLACTATDDGGGSLTAFKAIASNTTHAVALTSGGGLYSADGITWDPITESTPRVGNGRDVVWTGAAFVYITANGEVYASPTANGSFALKTTLPDGSADWRLAAGDAGEVLAYQHNLGAASDLWHSTNNGNTWAALTPLAAGRDVERLTCVRWHDGVWMATSSVAPFLWTSNDGTNWIALKPDVSGAGALQAIAWDGSSWLAAGNGFVVRCPRGADPAPGDYVADGSPATLADAATLRGRRITTSSPSDGDTLTWNATAEEWEYGPGGSSPTLAEGDLIIRGASADERLAIGGAGKVLTSNGTTATWEVGSPITTQGDLAIGDATGAPVRLAKGAEGKVLRAGATTVMWDDPPAPSGVATLDAANVFTNLQTFGKSSGTWGAPIPVAAFRHNNGGGSSWQGVAVRFEVKNDSAPAISYGYVVARAYGVGGDANNNLVEMRPAFSAGDPPVGLRVRCNVASAIWGVELLLAASGGSPTLQPCRESGSGDVDLTIRGLGAGVVRLPAATGFVGTVTEITALTRPAGVMAFATNASGGPKPCWSTGSAWVLADGSALS